MSAAGAKVDTGSEVTLSASREKTTGLVAAGFWCWWGLMEDRWVKNSENLSVDTYIRFFLSGLRP